MDKSIFNSLCCHHRISGAELFERRYSYRFGHDRNPILDLCSGHILPLGSQWNQHDVGYQGTLYTANMAQNNLHRQYSTEHIH